MSRLDQLTAFVKVAELGSYTRAAEALDLSRTRVSRQVMALEETLGARLIQRTTRRLHLTDAGERYLTHAQAILLALEAAADVGSGTHTCEWAAAYQWSHEFRYALSRASGSAVHAGTPRTRRTPRSQRPPRRLVGGGL
ncbi:hypothetical protein HAALTHF_05950n [Vreelandella aquamarina]|nr:hypothetical protein HAALTHF_05950n [Halomonas axialensis]